MARMKLNGELGWMDFRTLETVVEHGQALIRFEAKPKRWYALRPSFWLFAIRHLRRRPYSEDVKAVEP